MPIYEYECPKCGRFDVLQKMSAPALESHDVCGSTVKKLISASAFAFKGSGFYSTDYNGRNSAAITGKPEPKPDAKPEPKPDAKPGAKSDACASCPASKSAA
jgi:putative FmdB family regulatory protein